MVHYLQKIRAQNMDTIKKELALTMPDGAHDQEFRAILKRRFGFTAKAVNDYLNVMNDAGEIELNEKGVWKLS